MAEGVRETTIRHRAALRLLARWILRRHRSRASRRGARVVPIRPNVLQSSLDSPSDSEAPLSPEMRRR